MDIKAVLFDCDGTMFDTEIVSQRMWQETAVKYGITLPDDFTEKAEVFDAITVSEE